jgi:hypothetical protein
VSVAARGGAVVDGGAGARAPVASMGECRRGSGWREGVEDSWRREGRIKRGGRRHGGRKRCIESAAGNWVLLIAQCLGAERVGRGE